MNKQHGFTLLETLIYLAMLGLIFVGLFSAAFGILEGAGRLSAKRLVQEEGDFLLAKAEYALNGALAANIPNSQTFESVKSGGNDIMLFLDQDLFLNGIALNSIYVDVLPSPNCSNEVFARDGSGAVIVCFKLQALTLSGQSFSQEFRLTNRLKQ